MATVYTKDVVLQDKNQFTSPPQFLAVYQPRQFRKFALQLLLPKPRNYGQGAKTNDFTFKAKAKAKDAESCLRGTSRPTTRPRRLHLWAAVVVYHETAECSSTIEMFYKAELVVDP